ncbi:MAG: glutathione S-transferase [Betaproteobacteria bacterium]|nr:MAG: glutathione S-transferase [Betaproteobacteria bacterium]
MKLLGSPASPYTRKVRVVLAEKRIECEMALVDVQPVENPVNAHNPLGKIPTLLLDDGSAVYDSRVIVDFLDARSPISRLIPDETRDRLAVRRWEALADGVLDAGLLVRYESLRPQQERSQAWSDKQLARVHRGLAVMAKDLEGKPWCHNDRYSLADIAVGCCLGWLDFRKPGEVDWHTQYAGLAQHYRKLMERSAFADSVPQAPKA